MRDREECMVNPYPDPVGSAPRGHWKTLAPSPPPSLPGVITEMTMAKAGFLYHEVVGDIGAGARVSVHELKAVHSGT